MAHHIAYTNTIVQRATVIVVRLRKPGEKESAMDSILDTWKDKVNDQLVAWRLRLEQAKPKSVYATLSASALWPLLLAAQSESIVPVAMALGSVAAGVGGNLIAELIQRWRDQADGPSEADLETWIEAQVTTNAELRQALDAILEYVEAVPHAQADLTETDRQWFTQTLHDELTAMGNLNRFEAHLSGPGAIALGPGAVAAGQGGVAVGHDVHGNIYIGAAPPEPPQGLREAYLTWVTEQVRSVPLAGVDPKSIREDSRCDLGLAAVYTALMTQRSEGATERERHLDREAKRLSALAVLNTEPHLALLGDPGSGKSTFVNFVALCMAGELLGRSDANLQILRPPIPQDKAERFGQDEEAAEPQPWDRGPLLPIRLIPRDFVARGLVPAGQFTDISGDTL